MAEVQEGGLKRSFANLGATDITAAQAAARRPHIKADRPDTNSPEADASQEASMTNTDEKLREGFPMADLPIAGDKYSSEVCTTALPNSGLLLPAFT